MGICQRWRLEGLQRPHRGRGGLSSIGRQTRSESGQDTRAGCFLLPQLSAAQEAESNAEGRQRRRDSGEQQRGGSSSTDGEHQAGGWGLKGTVMKSGVLCGGYGPAGAVVL